MKKKILISLMAIVLCFVLAGCSSSKEETKESFTIVDKTKEMDDFTCAQSLEKFYEDDKYIYSYSCMKSEYVVVKYSDGKEETVKEALENKKITIEDLDKNNIQYYIDEK